MPVKFSLFNLFVLGLVCAISILFIIHSVQRNNIKLIPDSSISSVYTANR